MDNKDMPAMPISEDDGDRVDMGVKIYTGLTKREHFAGLAMQGLCHAIDAQGTWAHDSETVADAAVRYADALLAELDEASK